ncbi:hypothetical protein JHK85_010218 [Glycine max]|nr:hypothetical protein JHK85_010218 [Glycine max]
MSLNQVPVKRKKAEWCDKNTEIMLKVCIEEVNAGNKPHNHFTKLGWANIAEKFNKATNLRYEYKQFRNRWDSLKKKWQLWAKLIGKDTGLGWDGEKRTIAASDEWWEAKIQMLKLVVSASPLRLQLSSRHSMSLNLPHSANSLE